MSMSRKIVKQKYGDHFWVKREYDDYGNVTYYEDSIGDWWKREYDDRGNVICYEDSDGHWTKHEYDDWWQRNLLGKQQRRLGKVGIRQPWCSNILRK